MCGTAQRAWIPFVTLIIFAGAAPRKEIHGPFGYKTSQSSCTLHHHQTCCIHNRHGHSAPRQKVRTPSLIIKFGEPGPEQAMTVRAWIQQRRASFALLFEKALQTFAKTETTYSRCFRWRWLLPLLTPISLPPSIPSPMQFSDWDLAAAAPSCPSQQSHSLSTESSRLALLIARSRG